VLRYLEVERGLKYQQSVSCGSSGLPFTSIISASNNSHSRPHAVDVTVPRKEIICIIRVSCFLASYLAFAIHSQYELAPHTDIITGKHRKWLQGCSVKLSSTQHLRKGKERK
jgi:hypothetical protein